MSHHDRWLAGVDAITPRAAGTLDIYVVDRAETQRLVLAVLLAENPRARAIQDAVANTKRQIFKAAERRRPSRCAVCPRPILRVTDETVVILAVPPTGTTTHAMATACCPRCSGLDRAVIASKAAVHMARIWPGCRLVASGGPG